jgi:hypothetical protein
MRFFNGSVDSFTFDLANSNLSIAGSTPSTLTTNGALVVTGGVGVGGAVNVGGNSNSLGFVLNRTNNSGHYTGTSDNYGFTWTGTNGEMSTATGSMIFKPAATTSLTLTSTAATFAGATLTLSPAAAEATITAKGRATGTNPLATTSRGGLLALTNLDTTDNNAEAITFQNSNDLAIASIVAQNVSHAGRTGKLYFNISNGAAPVEAFSIAPNLAAAFAGAVSLSTAGTTVSIKSGTNAAAGTVTLVAGNGTITSTAIDVNTVIVMSIKTKSGSFDHAPSVVVAVGSATIDGHNSDDSTYNWIALKVN